MAARSVSSGDSGTLVTAIEIADDCLKFDAPNKSWEARTQKQSSASYLERLGISPQATMDYFTSMKNEAEWRSWNLNGLNVTQLLIDFRFHVHMWSLERDLLISFGMPFIFRSPTGEIHAFNPERNEELSPLLSLLHRSVVSFAASSEGECVLKFENGAALYGKPHEQYEAWESHGTGSLEPASLLCGVGGGSPWR